MHKLISIYTLFGVKHQYDLSAIDLYIHPIQTVAPNNCVINIPLTFIIIKKTLLSKLT